MPVIKSAIKKMRQDSKRRGINRLKKERLKSLIKTAQKEPTEKNIRAAISFIDKTAKSNLIHQNKASRLKSQVSKLLAKSGPAGGTTKKAKTAVKKKIKSIKTSPKVTFSPEVS